MFCNKCGTEIPIDSAFCGKCGSKVLTDQTTQPIQTPIASSQKAIPLYPNDAVRPAVQNNQIKSSIKKNLLISLSVVGVLFLLFIVYALLSPDTETSVAPQSSNASISEQSESSVASGTSATQSAKQSTIAKSTSAAQSKPAAKVTPKPAVSSKVEVSAKTKATPAPSKKTTTEKTVDINSVINKDVFDWGTMSDKEQLSLMSDILSVWKQNGDSVDTTAATLLKEVSENLSDQAVIFDVACQLHGIDAQKYFDMAK